MVNLKEYSNKKVAVLGLGAENEALILWLANKGVSVNLSIYDRREASALEDKQERISHLTGGLSINWQLGRKSYKSLKGYDELWRSPGWPIFCPQIQEAIQSGGVLNSPMNLFYPNICTFDCKTTEKIIKSCILFSFYILCSTDKSFSSLIGFAICPSIPASRHF